jgi:hypothetical protein
MKIYDSGDFYHVHAEYRDVITGVQDRDLKTVIRHYIKTTGNNPIIHKEKVSGFSHIDVMAKLNHSISPVSPIKTFDLLIGQLILSLQTTIRKHYDNHAQYLFFLSGGLDSRILLWVLESLADEIDVSKITFVTHEPEIDHAERAMRQFPKLRECPFIRWTEPYWIDTFGFQAGFLGFPLRFHPSDLDPAQYILLGGSYHGEMFEYPSSTLSRTWFGTRYINEGLYHYYMGLPNLGMNQSLSYYKDVFFPYLSRDYLQIVFSMSPNLFIPSDRGYGDHIRQSILKRFGDTVEVFRGHSYNVQFLDDIKNQAKKAWQNSQFFNTYSQHIGQVRVSQPWVFLHDKNNINSKLYGLASTLEGILQ